MAGSDRRWNARILVIGPIDGLNESRAADAAGARMGRLVMILRERNGGVELRMGEIVLGMRGGDRHG